ncbi:MAG: hypothetical protein U0Q16_22385 [Bryobacteraceae bacterium]
MQHFRVKLFAETAAGFDLGNFIPVFHRWIQSKALPGLLMDVADYRHVPSGPGVVLIGHDAHYSMDQGKRRLGLLYSRRTAAEGSAAELIREAYGAAREAARKIEQEPEFAGKIRFPGEFEVSVNDRMLAPNSEESWKALEPALTAALNAELGAGRFRVERTGERRELLTARVNAV